MLLRVRARDPASARCLLERSAAPGRKGSVLHGREPRGNVRPCEGAELFVTRGRARGTGRWHRGAPVGRTIVLCRGPVGKSPVFRRRGDCLHGVAASSSQHHTPGSSTVARRSRLNEVGAEARQHTRGKPIRRTEVVADVRCETTMFFGVVGLTYHSPFTSAPRAWRVRSRGRCVIKITCAADSLMI